MPYTKIGFIRKSRSQYIPQYCSAIIDYLGPTFDSDIAAIIKSLGHERILLKNFFFERCLQVNYPKLEANPEIKINFMVVLADFLHQVGFINVSPAWVDYKVDPVMAADELLDKMLAARLPKWAASDLGGDSANIDTLMNFMPEVIRRQALILNERPLMADRFRQWIGNIGFRVLVGEAISQAERSFLVVYSSTKQNTKGWISGLPPKPIAPVEIKEPLVMEVGALATATAMAGPCINHMKLASNGILEQLLFYYGNHVDNLKGGVGYAETKGPFINLVMTPTDIIAWPLESQLIGISSTAQDFMVRIEDLPPFTLQMPFIEAQRNMSGLICAYPDLPDFRLWLTDRKDVSRFTWDYFSKWRGRRINSLTDAGTMDLALADMAVTIKAQGSTQVESDDLASFGLMWMTPAAEAKLLKNPDALVEDYLLPSSDGTLKWTPIPMGAFYARFGKVQTLPALAETLRMPLEWFMTPAEQVVEYVSSYKGLTLEETIRFRMAISICHNCARFTRLTQTPVPLDKEQLIRTLLSLPAKQNATI
jgi:hypothetical protein